MMDKFRFLILLLIVISIKVWNWRKNPVFFAVQEESKIFILFLRDEKNEKEEESTHEEKSGNIIFLNR